MEWTPPFPRRHDAPRRQRTRCALRGYGAEFDPLVHHVDTGGVSDHVFALFHLLGLLFAPRLRDFPDRRLTCFGRPSRWRALSAIMGRPVNEGVVLEHWSDVLRLAAVSKPCL